MIPLEQKLTEALQALEAARVAGEWEYVPEPEPLCSTCNDLGMIKFDVPIGDPRFGKLFPCPNPDCVVANERRATQTLKRFQQSRLPLEFAGCTFASWESGLDKAARRAKMIAYEAALAFCTGDGCYVDLAEIVDRRTTTGWPDNLDRRPKNWLVLYGEYGVGKTGLAAAIFNCLVEKGMAGVYVHTGDLFVSLQATFKEDADESLKQALQRYKDAPLLFLDDLQVFNPTDFRRETMELIIGYRHANILPTLITTNLNPDEFRNTWEGAAASRVAHRAHWVHVPPPVLRSQNGSIG